MLASVSVRIIFINFIKICTDVRRGGLLLLQQSVGDRVSLAAGGEMAAVPCADQGGGIAVVEQDIAKLDPAGLADTGQDRAAVKDAARPARQIEVREGDAGRDRKPGLRRLDRIRGTRILKRLGFEPERQIRQRRLAGAAKPGQIGADAGGRRPLVFHPFRQAAVVDSERLRQGRLPALAIKRLAGCREQVLQGFGHVSSRYEGRQDALSLQVSGRDAGLSTGKAVPWFIPIGTGDRLRPSPFFEEVNMVRIGAVLVVLSASLVAGGLPAAAQTIPGLGGSGSSGASGVTGLAGQLAGQALPSVSSASTNNTAGVLSYCVKNKYVKAQTATSVLSRLTGSSATQSSSAFATGQQGNLETGNGSLFSLDSLKDKAREKVCDMVLEHAQSGL